MTPATLVLAASLVAWGPPAPPEAGASTADGATTSTGSGAGAVPTPTDVAQPVAPAPVAPPAPPPAQIPPATSQIPIIAKAPVNVRATPALVAAPAAPPGRDLHRQWWFWAIAGGCFAGVILATILATRPGPDPYTGNTPPYRVPFP